MIKTEPLYLRIKNKIRDEIRDGQWKPDQIIYSENEICKTFKVSRITAVRVLDELEKEQYVRREKGRGTIVNISGGCPATGVVSVVMPTTGHVYFELFHRLLNFLEAKNYHVVTYTPSSIHVSHSPEANRARWEKLLSFKPEVLIIDGQDWFPLGLYEEYADKNPFTVFICNYDYPCRLPGGYALSDEAKGGLYSAALALDRGYERILLYSYGFSKYEVSFSQRMEAVKSVCQKRNKEFIFVRGSNRPGMRLKEIEGANIGDVLRALRQAGANTAVLCGYDAQARIIIKAARQLGWKIPGDLGIIGYYNTPWSDQLGLASVSLCEEEIVSAAGKLVLDKREDTIIIAPKIIERESLRK